MTQTVSAALARKLSVGQEGQGDKPRSVLRALRLAFARAAGDRLHLPLVVIGAKQSGRPADALTERVGEDWLLLQFVKDDGTSAAICMDMGVVSAIVQVQTIGEVMPAAPASRPFTHTDAAMVAPSAEEALSRAIALVDAPADQSCLAGYEYASRLADLRIMSLAMVEDTYRIFDLTVELGGGLRQGQISVFLPDLPAETDEDGAISEETGPNLDQASGVMRAELNTVICRMTLPLASLSHLGVGDVLPLAGSRLDRAEVLTIDRSRIAIGRLGQCGGMRAVRLNEYNPPTALAPSEAEEFLEARSTLPRHEADTPAQADISLMHSQSEVTTVNDLESSLNFADSDQMVAEISQLAGLTGPEEDQGKPG